MDGCVLLTSTPSCVVSPRGDPSGCALGIARPGETTHSGVDVNNTHPSMINPLSISLQTFGHAMTAQLSCHVQNFIVITSLQLGWGQNEFSIEFELWWKNISWNGPQDYINFSCFMFQNIQIHCSLAITQAISAKCQISSLASGFPSQKATNAKYISMSWHCNEQWVLFALSFWYSALRGIPLWNY